MKVSIGDLDISSSDSQLAERYSLGCLEFIFHVLNFSVILYSQLCWFLYLYAHSADI